MIYTQYTADEDIQERTHTHNWFCINQNCQTKGNNNNDLKEYLATNISDSKENIVCTIITWT